MTSSTSLKALAVLGPLLGLAMQTASASDITLTFDVSNLTRQVCTGLLAPTCTFSSASGFTESLTLDSTAFATSDSSGFGVLDTSALFGYPFASTGNPYTSALQSILSQSPTTTQASTTFENVFDTSPGGSGFASGFFNSDQSYSNGGSYGEFQQTYDLFATLSFLSGYQDLTSTSLLAFVAPLVNQLTGSFFESGTASELDPNSLAFVSYAYTSYSGDATLIGVTSAVAAVPEPESFALLGVGLAAIGLRRRAFRNAHAST